MAVASLSYDRRANVLRRVGNKYLVGVKQSQDCHTIVARLLFDYLMTIAGLSLDSCKIVSLVLYLVRGSNNIACSSYDRLALKCCNINPFFWGL